MHGWTDRQKDYGWMDGQMEAWTVEWMDKTCHTGSSTYLNLISTTVGAIEKKTNYL